MKIIEDFRTESTSEHSKTSATHHQYGTHDHAACINNASKQKIVSMISKHCVIYFIHVDHDQENAS